MSKSDLALTIARRIQRQRIHRDSVALQLRDGIILVADAAIQTAHIDGKIEGLTIALEDVMGRGATLSDADIDRLAMVEVL